MARWTDEVSWTRRRKLTTRQDFSRVRWNDRPQFFVKHSPARDIGLLLRLAGSTQPLLLRPLSFFYKGKKNIIILLLFFLSIECWGGRVFGITHQSEMGVVVFVKRTSRPFQRVTDVTWAYGTWSIGTSAYGNEPLCEKRLNLYPGVCL